MYVKPEFSGRKVGLALLRAAIDEAFKTPEIEQLILGVSTKNPSANRVYEQAGFTEYGLHRNHLKDGDRYVDERLMILFRRLV